jgi:PAS domain S-box-containing protein
MKKKIYQALQSKLPVYFSISVMAVCLLALAGWIFDIAILKRPADFLPAMNPLSAILFLIAAVTGLALSAGQQNSLYLKAAGAGALFVLLVATARCADILLNLNWQIDRVLFANQLLNDGMFHFINGMGLNTAAGFVLLALAIALSATNNFKYKRLANLAAFIVLIIGLFSILGYLYEVPEFFYALNYMPISLQSAGCFVLMACAVFLINANAAFMFTVTSPLLGGLLARRLIPVILFLPVALGFLRLWLSWHIRFSAELGVAALTSGIIVVFFGLVWYLAHQLNNSDNARTAAETSLQKFNKDLEGLVTERTAKLNETSNRFRATLDSLLEGVQIIDPTWHYTYVNDALVAQSTYTREQLLGKSILESYPGVEHTPLFAKLKACMEQRLAQKFQTEFNYPNGTTSYFEMSIQPVPEGIFILSADISEQYLANEKIIKLNRLYSFLSAVNQSIVHATGAKPLFDTLCQTATTIGQFKNAWVGIIDDKRHLNMVASSGEGLAGSNASAYMNIDYTSPQFANSIPAKVLRTGQYAYSNDVINEPGMEARRELLEQAGVQSSIALPIKKFGVVVGLMAFHSAGKNFFDEAELALLEEAAMDVSFALEVLDKEEQRQKAENQLAQSESHLKRAQRIAHVGHWSINLINGETQWSDEVFRIYGLNPATDTLSMPDWKTFLHPEEADQIIAYVNECFTNYNDYAFDHRIVWRNGVVRYLHAEVKVEKDTAGKALSFYGIVHDITDARLQEETIRTSQANLSAIIENTSDFIYSLDTKFRYITFNSHIKNTIKLFYGLEIKPGLLVYEFLKNLDPADAAYWENIYTQALSGKTIQFIKEYNVAGTQSFTHFFINPIRRGQDIIGLACIGRDVTQEKLAELEIKALNESLELKVRERTAQLEEVNKELETFSYTVSHDLQAPLRSLSGFSKILLTDYKDKLDADASEFLNIIDMNARRMGQLIRDLLAFSQLGKQPLKAREVDMNVLVSVAVAQLKSHIPDFNATLKIQPLWATHCDEALMLQVWTNLIGNAIKYSGKKQQPVIEIGMIEKEGQQAYYIKDNGAGFDMAHAGKLFGAFQRLHHIGDFEGSGIGLSTVHRIITRHGGHIWAEGKINEGATFYFTLP